MSCIESPYIITFLVEHILTKKGTLKQQYDLFNFDNCQNVSWRHHMTNQELYGSLSRIATIVRQRRLRLAGHVMRHDEAANKVLLWKPDGPRRRGRPTTTLLNILEKDTNLSGTNLIAAIKNRTHWKEIIMSPH